MPNVHDPVGDVVAFGAECTEFPAVLAEGSEARTEWLDPSTMPEPAPLRYTVGNLIPEGWITTLYGRGGSGKSLLALIVAYSIVLGRSVFGCPVLQGTVLYVDGELSSDEFRRRSYRVCRGFGLTKPPAGVNYRRFHGNLSDPKSIALLESAIRQFRPQLVVVDSFEALLLGRDTNSINDVVGRLRHLESLSATVLLIDHVSRASDLSNVSGPIGSVGKFNVMRSGIYVHNTRNGVGIVRPDKSNFGPLHDPIPLAIEFEDSTVRLVAPLPVGDPRVAPLEAGLKAEDRVLRLLMDEEQRDGLSAGEIANRLELNLGTVRNALSELKKAGKVDNCKGRWRSLTHTSSEEVSE